MPEKTDILFKIQHGDNTTEYTDWDVARATLVQQLNQQWTDDKGAPASKSAANARAQLIDSTIFDAQHGITHGLGGVRLVITGINTLAVPQERIEDAQKATDAAQSLLNSLVAA